MMKINKYFNQLIIVVRYFNMREWTFHRGNVCKMAEDIKVLRDSNRLKLFTRYGLEEVYYKLSDWKYKIHFKRKI